MSLREGACATYIGMAHDDAEVGDRCLVLSDEGRYANVRWLTGHKVGSYDLVTASELVADRKTKISAFDDDDAFGFEVDVPKAVRVATRAVHSNGGNAALMRALDHDGVLEAPRRMARQAVAELRNSLLGDRSWVEVVSELGDDGADFLRHAMAEMVASALNEGDHDAPED